MNLKTLIFLFFLSVFFISCEHEIEEPIPPALKEDTKNPIPPNVCDSTKVYYLNNIQPILTSTCSFNGCHDAGTATLGVTLTTYENLINSSVVVAGDTANSILYQRITETDMNLIMPKGGPSLPQDQIQKIGQWIMDGALNSSCEEKTNCDTTNITFSMSIAPIISNKCQGCHSGNRPGGGISLTNYNEINVIAADQRLLSVVLHDDGFKAMPLGGDMLPECEIEAIRVWINAGSPNN